MSSLASKLAEKSPQDADAYLAQVWKDFASTEAADALTGLIDKLAREADGLLLSPHTAPHARAHAAGAVAALRRLVISMNACATFDPSKAEYTEPDFSSGPDADSTPEDTTQLI